MRNNKSFKKNRTRKSIRHGAGVPNGVPQLLPPVSYMDFTYNQAIGLTESAAGLGSNQVYRINSIYDPVFTGTGITAAGYSAISNLYTKFLVHMVTLRIEFVNTSATAVSVGWFVSASSSLPASTTWWASQPYSDTALLGPTAGGGNKKIWNVKIPLWKVAGLTRQQYVDEADYRHGVGANPITPLYLQTWTKSNLGTVSTVNSLVRMVLHTQLEAPATVQ